MKLSKRAWLFSLFGLLILALLLTFAAGAALAEGAIHPILKRRASDTAALAHSIAQAIGATERQVFIATPDGVQLDAWWLSSPRSNGRAVIVCHGVGDSAFGGLGFALLFLHHGYSVLVPDSRGHGQSGGFVTYGVLESVDIVQWLNWLKGQGITRSYGIGESLGAATSFNPSPKVRSFRPLLPNAPTRPSKPSPTSESHAFCQPHWPCCWSKKVSSMFIFVTA